MIDKIETFSIRRQINPLHFTNTNFIILSIEHVKYSNHSFLLDLYQNRFVFIVKSKSTSYWKFFPFFPFVRDKIVSIFIAQFFVCFYVHEKDEQEKTEEKNNSIPRIFPSERKSRDQDTGRCQCHCRCRNERKFIIFSEHYRSTIIIV